MLCGPGETVTEALILTRREVASRPTSYRQETDEGRYTEEAAGLPSPLLPARRRLRQVPSRGLPPRLQQDQRPAPGRPAAGPEHPASSTSALSLRPPRALPRHGAPSRQPAGDQSARAAAPVLEPLLVCSEPALCERSPGRHCRLLARRAAPRSPGGARCPRRPRCRVLVGPRGGQQGSERGRGDVSVHARGSPERTPVPSGQRPLRTQKEAVFTPTPAGEPAPLPSTGPPGAGRPHMGDARG